MRHVKSTRHRRRRRLSTVGIFDTDGFGNCCSWWGQFGSCPIDLQVFKKCQITKKLVFNGNLNNRHSNNSSVSIQPWWLGSLGHYSHIQLTSTFWQSVDRIPLEDSYMVIFTPTLWSGSWCNMSMDCDMNLPRWVSELITWLVRLFKCRHEKVWI